MSFKPYNTVILKMSNGNVSFVSGSAFGMNVLFRKDTHGIFKIRLVSVGRDINKLYRIMFRNEQYILCISEHVLYIYSKDSIELCKHDLKDQVIKSCCTADLNDNGEENILLITGKKDQIYGDNFLIMSLKTNAHDGYTIVEYYHHPFEGMNPWKVQTADVDGDGKKDISIGMFKKTPFHPVMAKRPFVYEWSGNGLSPKWLGSRLSRPFDDYLFADINKDGKDELISIESLDNGGKVLNSYGWRGFGFEAMTESPGFEDISEINMRTSKEQNVELEARIKEKGKWEWRAFYYSKEGLVPRNVFFF